MLADSGAAWTDIIAQHNSGTYNNQYVVVDLKRFRPGQVTTSQRSIHAPASLPHSSCDVLPPRCCATARSII